MRTYPGRFSSSVRTGLPAAVFVWIVIVAAAPSGAGGFVDQPTSTPSSPAVPISDESTPEETGAPGETDEPWPWVLAAGIFAAGTALGATGSRLATARRGPAMIARHTTTTSNPQPRSRHDGSDAPSGVVDRLVEGLIASYDLATDDGQRSRIVETLLLADVTAIEPAPLTTFDPSLHHVLRVVHSNDPAQVGLVAGTERPGWSRRGDILRAPDVSVYPLRSAPPG